MRNGYFRRPAGTPAILSARHLPAALALLVAVALWLPGIVAAQEPPPHDAASTAAPVPEAADAAEAEPPSMTGDAWLDAQLADIDRYGRRYREAFIDELVRYREAPRSLVEALLEDGWEPGDVYFACSLARVTGRSCRFIANQRGHPAAGPWHPLATGLGAGPGTEGFARLKRGVVHSYQRWARPLELDAELAEAFPGHGQTPPQDSAEGSGD